jgi:replicative DNA helicase
MTTVPFDQAFQEQLAAHYLRDDGFVSAVGSLVEPEYFENETLAALVAVQKMYLDRYNACCTLKTFVQVLGRFIAAKKVKIADMNEAKRLMAILYKDPLKDRQFVIDTIADFARTAAITNATMNLVDAIDANDPVKVDKALIVMDEAKQVGAADAKVATDFGKTRSDRQQRRAAMAAGTYLSGGITTGHDELDQKLTPWRGWGRKELSILMAPPKAGKTAAQIHFALNAAKAGFKVFYASCEVSEDIIGDRADANISGVPLAELAKRVSEVDKAVEAWEQVVDKKGGAFMVEAFAIRTLKVSELRRVLKRYQQQGIEFDMVVVDYLGIMKPESHYNEKRHGLAEIGQDLRALATEYPNKQTGCAVLTAYQTNREGTKKAQRNVAEGTDAADDYEVVRSADALITINRDEDMRANGETLLYFSEMRNAESGLKLRFGQDLSCMQFLQDFRGYQ